MNDLWFNLSNVFVLPFWLLLILFPHWRFTKWVAQSPLIALPPALIYAALAVPQLPTLLASLAQPELNAVANLIGTPEGATLAWAHFLAFDLFVGRWIYLDSRKLGISAWLVGPVLFATLMVGPVGWLLYLGLRWVWQRSTNAPAGA